MQFRRTRTSVLALAALATGALGAGAALAPAQAATSGDTVTTFTITSGNLSVSAPSGTVNLGSVSAGTPNVTGNLGTVTVTDNRGSILGGWTATVDSTDWAYKDASNNANSTYDLAKTAGSYLAGVVSDTGGNISAGVGGAFGATPVLAAKRVAGLAGNSSASWNPTITVLTGPTAPAGTYTATITHSVN